MRRQSLAYNALACWCALGHVALAQEPLPAPQVSAWAGRGAVLSEAGARWVWWARAAGRWPLSSRLTLVGRGEVSGLPERLVAGDTSTYQSGELYGGLLLRLRPRLDAAAVHGTTWRLDGEPQPDRPGTWGVGARVDVPGGGWVYALLGSHGAAGSGLRPIVVAHLPLRGGLAVEVDAVGGGARRGWQRAGLAWQIPLPGERQ